MSDFQDKVVVITGAGGGLGKAHALEFARRGAKVVVNDLGGSGDGVGASDMADAVVEEITGAGGTAIANKASVADMAGAQSIIDDAVSAFGTIDILVNNAGILRDKSFKNMDMGDWDLVMNVHLNGTGYVTRAAWPIMYEKNYGRIVLTSSTSGIYGNFGQANYGAAKMGMLGIMNVLAIEGLSKNIKVNCLAPAAETRLIGTIPGVEVDPDNPDPMRHPRLVTPAVLLMCAEDAPTNKTIHAGNGRFSSSATFVNEALEFGVDVTYEDLLEKKDQLLDLSNANEMSGLIRVMKAQKG
ncbi:MAG: SDR family NAD(P)-dependent oxidoreductase [Pseudomonadales bacterium]|jgi:NAD(P)-dependent dehydrogenase (short-subunit alcohol dehydrogenase family)|nr:3-oxoacyl-ACP reductase [Gammaproteobacteria bacterium]MDP7575800.1 SDR family NAD(P)-dependent oxidoreductase [Pseudomonadales bacterium]|tara:strand:+ start:5797 stop:6690 length:894 start_codon:yes stop_codon:yes gene_type:complete